MWVAYGRLIKWSLDSSGGHSPMVALGINNLESLNQMIFRLLK